MDEQTPVPTNKPAFPSKRRNKQRLIKLLERHLERAGISVDHAGEGDADVVIVMKALELLKLHENVLVIADDTDVLILLLHHASYTDKLFMETNQQIIFIKVAKEVLGRELYMCLLFAHAMSGCDTTSALYGMGKLKCMKILESSQLWRSDVLVFGDPEHLSRKSVNLESDLCNRCTVVVQKLKADLMNYDTSTQSPRSMFQLNACHQRRKHFITTAYESTTRLILGNALKHLWTRKIMVSM